MENLKHALLKQSLLKLAADERGQDLIEYALMASLLGLGTLAALRGVKNNVSNTLGSVGNQLTNAVA